MGGDGAYRAKSSVLASMAATSRGSKFLGALLSKLLLRGGMVSDLHGCVNAVNHITFVDFLSCGKC